MSLSKETEVIFDVRRGKDYDSANPPLYDSSTFHQKVLGGGLNMIMHEVVTLTELYLKRNLHV